LGADHEISIPLRNTIGGALFGGDYRLSRDLLVGVLLW